MRRISVEELKINPATSIAKDWMLITAGSKERGYNTMTASWGHIGAIWDNGGGKPTAMIYVRPQRYTKEFVDREEFFTLSFFSAEHKKKLGYLGTHSGRNEDKVAKAGLTPSFGNNYTYFEEANLVLVCRKLYHAPILEEGFTDKRLVEEIYPKRDFHEMYVGEIIDAYVEDGKNRGNL